MSPQQSGLSVVKSPQQSAAPKSKPPEMNTDVFCIVLALISTIVLALLFMLRGHYYEQNFGDDKFVQETSINVSP